MEKKMRVLIANDPRVYRELIADALLRLRPLVEVSIAEPEEFDRAVELLRPHLVICSRTSAAVQAMCLRWVVLYPDGEDRAEVGGGGAGRWAARLLYGVGLADLLSVVDETEFLWRAAERRGA
jgi:hypothetical protein